MVEDYVPDRLEFDLALDGQEHLRRSAGRGHASTAAISMARRPPTSISKARWSIAPAERARRALPVTSSASPTRRSRRPAQPLEGLPTTDAAARRSSPSTLDKLPADDAPARGAGDRAHGRGGWPRGRAQADAAGDRRPAPMIGVKPLFSGRSLGEGENAGFDVDRRLARRHAAGAQRPALRAAQGRDHVPMVSPRRRLGLRAGEDDAARRRRHDRCRRRHAGADFAAGAMGPLSSRSVDRRPQRAGDLGRLRCRLVRRGERRHAGHARNRARQAGIRAGREHDGRGDRPHRRQGDAQRDRRPADQPRSPRTCRRAPRSCACRSATTGAAAPMWWRRCAGRSTRSAERMPGRAIGVQWFAINRKARTLALDMELPPLMRPNTRAAHSGQDRRARRRRGGAHRRRRGRRRHPQPHQLQAAGARRLLSRPAPAHHRDPRPLRPAHRRHAGRARPDQDRRRRRRRRAAGQPADAEAAGALFRPRHRRARRHRRGRCSTFRISPAPRA